MDHATVAGTRAVTTGWLGLIWMCQILLLGDFALQSTTGDKGTLPCVTASSRCPVTR